MVQSLKNNHNSVEVLNDIDNEAYDVLLSRNIVFIELVDCTVANTIIECIVRNTPILINRLPAIIELLGEEYPFFYKNINEANQKVKI